MDKEYNYDDLIRSSRKYKADKDKKFNDNSKERLLKIARKKIETTMMYFIHFYIIIFSFIKLFKIEKMPVPMRMRKKRVESII